MGRGQRCELGGGARDPEVATASHTEIALQLQIRERQHCFALQAYGLYVVEEPHSAPCSNVLVFYSRAWLLSTCIVFNSSACLFLCGVGCSCRDATRRDTVYPFSYGYPSGEFAPEWQKADLVGADGTLEDELNYFR